MHLEKYVHQPGQRLILLVNLGGIDELEFIIAYLALLPRQQMLIQ